MGSRGRSIRLRIYFLVAIPLVALIGLLGYVAGTSINNAIDLDRAPSLINATSLPTAKFVSYLQTERAAAVVYLFEPTAANLQAYNTAIAATDGDESAFVAAMNSPATVSSETPSEYKAITGVVAGVDQLGTLRNAVKAQALSPLAALTAYSQGISAEPRLFLVIANSETDTIQLGQAMGLIATVQAREQLSQEDALLSGMLAGMRMTAKDRVALTDMAATRQADAQYADGILSPANLATFNASLAGSGSMQQDLANVEQAIAAGTPLAQLPVTQAQWQQLAGALLQDDYNGGVGVASAILAADHQTSHAAWVKIAIAGGIALLVLLLTILVTTIAGRGIIRRLRGLERSAIALAEDQLPDVIARLRHSQDVDVAAEAPPLEVGPGLNSPGLNNRDEIGRVGQAFDLVRQTAIQAAVDEAKLRRGINDVFRSLARRSQSLLHRQLTLLDQMERRATDPEALDDLFRLDHLTTRMRRHAEGLVILAGAPPGRGWSSPVRMVDVMRGAIAEVEDYARVSVATRSQAALSGPAVADVIHLLAELIENATTLSPPYTSVRVAGETVASGFAIEVEDRGLGMSPERLAELNERLASPPEFNPSDSEQLGLFVVGQLGKRHSIRVTLKASPYGGTSAVVLIPRHLVVTEEAFRAGLPGEPAAITMTATVTNGNRPAAGELTGPSSSSPSSPSPSFAAPSFPAPSFPAPSFAAPSFPGPSFPAPRSVPGLAETPPGVRISGPLRRAQASDGLVGGAHASPRRPGPAPGANGGRAPWEPVSPVAPGAPVAPVSPFGSSDPLGPLDPEELPRRGRANVSPGPGAGGADAATNGAAASAFDVFMPRRRGQDGAGTAVPADAPAGREPAVGGTGHVTPTGAAASPLPQAASAGPRAVAGGGPHPAMPAPIPADAAPRRGDTQPNPVLGGGPQPVVGGGPNPAAGGGPQPVVGGGPNPAAGGGPQPVVGGAPNPVAGGAPQPSRGAAPYPPAGAPPYPAQPGSFPGWTGQSTVGAPVGGHGQAAPPTPMTPVASPRTQKGSGPPWEVSRQTGPLPAVPNGPDPRPDAGGDVNELPRRVKQANLAPQLRGEPSRRLKAPTSPAAPGGGPTPAEIRQTMSALQRGWQEGRTHRRAPGDQPLAPGPAASQAQAADPATAGTATAGTATAGTATAGANASPGADPATGTDTEAHGGTDGT
jgi:signal transduction histidine kinase